MSGDEVDWIRQYATDSQIRAILEQRNRLIAQNAELRRELAEAREKAMERAATMCDELVGKIQPEWAVDDVLLHMAYEIREEAAKKD